MVKKSREELVVHRTAYTFEPAGSDRLVAVDHSDQVARCAVGGTHTVEAAAPGIGRWTWRITRIDDRGAWGVLESDTVRELTPSECV